jgi:hypothetical protein
MDNELRYPLTELTGDSVLRLSNAQGRTVAVFEGRVWITQENDLRDIVLARGESFTIDRPGLTLVQAFGHSKLMLLHSGHGRDELAAQPDAYELHRSARLQRSVEIGNALAAAAAALRRLLALPESRPARRPGAQPLRTCAAGC